MSEPSEASNQEINAWLMSLSAMLSTFMVVLGRVFILVIPLILLMRRPHAGPGLPGAHSEMPHQE